MKMMTTTFHRFVFAALCLLALSPSLLAADPTPEERLAGAQSLVKGLHWQQGEISLRGGLAKLKVPADFRYLGPQDAQTVLTKIWGNPPGTAPLGMLFPANVGPIDDGAWGVVITYEEDGYVKDDEAAKLDYNKLMKEMQEGTKESNEERLKRGYPPIELIGWAAPPRYDGATHKLYWAKELSFGEGEEHTLNYDIRILGRRGVLVLNAVAGIGQTAEIEKVTPQILGMIDFQEGHRYTDFDIKSDKVAEYGIAALVAGGILGKAGFFKVLLTGLLAAKKFVIIGLVAIGSWLKKLFGGKKEAEANSLRQDG